MLDMEKWRAQRLANGWLWLGWEVVEIETIARSIILQRMMEERLMTLKAMLRKIKEIAESQIDQLEYLSGPEAFEHIIEIVNEIEKDLVKW